MGEEREIVRVSSDAAKAATEPAKSIDEVREDHKPVQEAALTRAEKKAVFAKVLERGIINARLEVPLPDDVHGEWVRDDETEIMRMESMGFEVDTVHAKKRRLHSKGDGASYVGDVLFMTCDRENYEIIQEVKQDLYNKMHGDQAAQKEDSDYATKVQASTPEVPVIEESTSKAVDREDIVAALQSK